MVNQIHRLELSQIGSPRIRRFHDHWEAIRSPQDIVPRRASFNPTDLRELLPNIVVIEVEREPLRFRYRLVGTRVVEFNRRDFTGAYLGDIGWQIESQIIDLCTDVAVGKAPLWGSYAWTLRNGGTAKCEFGVLPFSGDGSTVTQLFGIEDYDFPRDHKGTRSRPRE